MFDEVLVPTDGSDPAGTAVDCATALAHRFDATLHVVHVLELGEIPPGLEDVAAGELERRGTERLSDAAERARARGVETETAVLETTGQVSTAIVTYADDHDVDLLVMGTHGHTGLDRYFLGSVTTRTLLQATMPVVTVHEETMIEPDVAFETVLVGTDGSDAARSAVEYGARLAAETEAALHLVNAVDIGALWGSEYPGTILAQLETTAKDALAEARGVASDAGVSTVEANVLEGPPAREVLRYAEDEDVDAIVLGSHGRQGFDRILLGSVTERVVRRSERPVFVTKAGQTD